VTLLPQPNQDAAIEVFNNDEADVVAGWEPRIFDAEKSGGQLLASTREFRSILGGIVMSRQAMQNKRTVIQLFHDAWFEALAQQESDFDAAAAQIAQWGNNDYLGVKQETATEDLRGLLAGVAQANLADNVRAFSNVSAIVERLLQTRKLWASAGLQVPGGDVTQIVTPEFVQASANVMQVDVNAPSKLVNNTFSLGRTQARAQNPADASQSAAEGATTQGDALATAQTVATLPCSRFEFVPNSTDLQAASQQELRDCAVRVLQQNINLYVRVKGSAAWPGPQGSYTQQQVEGTARQRAQAVINFLIAQGINQERFLLEWTLPPQDHWETSDLTKQARDRYVEIALLASGL
jgi:outer membrane protein OmpA-like peptidoglycan-associated protein